MTEAPPLAIPRDRSRGLEEEELPAQLALGPGTGGGCERAALAAPRGVWVGAPGGRKAAPSGGAARVGKSRKRGRRGRIRVGALAGSLQTQPPPPPLPPLPPLPHRHPHSSATLTLPALPKPPSRRHGAATSARVSLTFLLAHPQTASSNPASPSTTPGASPPLLPAPWAVSPCWQSPPRWLPPPRLWPRRAPAPALAQRS